MKSNSISKGRRGCGIWPVVNPRGDTYSVVCQQWLTGGVWTMRTLPAICIHRWSVVAVSAQSESGSGGQSDIDGKRTLGSAMEIDGACDHIQAVPKVTHAARRECEECV